MTRVRASPFQNQTIERTISHAQPPAVDKVSHLLDSKQPKGSRSQLPSGFFYPADQLIGFRNVGSRFTTGFW